MPFTSRASLIRVGLGLGPWDPFDDLILLTCDARVLVRVRGDVGMSLSNQWAVKPKKVRRQSGRSGYRAGQGLLPFPVFGGRGALFPSRSLVRRMPPQVFAQMGNLEVQLAQTRRDIKRAQRLRYRVFYNEMSAIADASTVVSRRDRDPYDPVCDHLMVVDKGQFVSKRRPWPARPRVVGTYRLLRQDVAERYDGFYTQGEYDIEPLLESKRDQKFLELGRSCVLKPYRNKRTLELLWHGIASYVEKYECDVLLGCASFEGTDPKQHALGLSFLYHHALAPDEWRVCAHDHLRVDMDMMPKEDIDLRAAMRSLPPLIKGYLRLGAHIGDGAVVDHQFGTTDVFIVLPREAITGRYLSHFGVQEDGRSRGDVDVSVMQ